jgi:hypothetical protein
MFDRLKAPAPCLGPEPHAKEIAQNVKSRRKIALFPSRHSSASEVLLHGLDWVATVPPTVVLCREYFGPVRAAVVFGWVFAFHMVGTGVGALAAGIGRDLSGSYLIAWITAAVLCFPAAASLFLMPGSRKAVAEVAEEIQDEVDSVAME